MKTIIIGVTGASGSVLAHQTVLKLLALGYQVHFITTELGARVMAYELEQPFTELLQNYAQNHNFVHHKNDDLFASISSGSFPIDAMCILPCSMGTLGKIAGGISDSLICRAADVTLKERRPLLLVTRETPLSGIHLENMLKLSRYGAIIMPPMPAYYNRPKTVEALIDHTVSRILRTLGVTSDSDVIWTGGEPLFYE